MVNINQLPSVFGFDDVEIEWAIPGILPMSAITAITGDSGSGKTTFAMFMAGHIASGSDFLGRPCVQRPVLVLDRENSLPVVRERLTRLKIYDEPNLIIAGGWLPGLALHPGSPEVLSWTKETWPRPVIIVDVLRAFLEGDENDSCAMRRFMSSPRRLADAGACVLLLHHTGRAGGNYRGSSDFKASVDVAYTLHNSSTNRLDRLVLRAFKQRFNVEQELKLVYSDDWFFPAENNGR